MSTRLCGTRKHSSNPMTIGGNSPKSTPSPLTAIKTLFPVCHLRASGNFPTKMYADLHFGQFRANELRHFVYERESASAELSSFSFLTQEEESHRRDNVHENGNHCFVSHRSRVCGFHNHQLNKRTIVNEF